MKLKLSIVFIIIGAIVFAYSQGENKPFAQAEDFPREALVYAQFSDLSAFIKSWNETELAKNILESYNYAEYTNRHLGIKISERLQNFNYAIGFSIDAEILSGVTETRAAIAIYDIGKIDVVFIAPVSDEIFTATKFFQNKGKFEEYELEDGNKFYAIEVEVDRKRQKQNIVFANVKGRFILATNQKLLFQTIAVIEGKSANSSLADEPLFTNLTKKIAPHQATVWVNQEKLNDDYYFKNYWLAGNLDELKNFRAGMFDLEMSEGVWTERREFLLKENREKTAGKISVKEANDLRANLPENIPFYKTFSALNKPEVSSKLIKETLFDRFERDNKSSNTNSWNRARYSDGDYYSNGAERWILLCLFRIKIRRADQRRGRCGSC